MWVSTNGKDTPHCVHDKAENESLSLQHQTIANESCKTLNYVLTQNLKDSIIRVMCGTHLLKPLASSPDMRNISVVGECLNGKPQIQCTEGANLAFYNVQLVGIENIAFLDCGEQLQHGSSLSDSSALYFEDCETVTIRSVSITTTGPYGRGISFIRNNTTHTHGEVLMDSIVINHFGYHGSGIHCEVVTGRTMPIASENLRLIQRNIEINSVNAHPRYNLTTAFTGINITVMGDGAGGEITLSSVTVKTTTRGSGISIALLEKVSSFTVRLCNLTMTEESDSLHNCYSSNMTESSIKCYEHLTAANNSGSTAYSNTKIELRGNSFRNHIQVEAVSIKSLSSTPGSAFSIEVADFSGQNHIQLQEVILHGPNSSEAHRRGLQIILTKQAKGNVIQVSGLHSCWYRSSLGAGAYIEFSGHAMENEVQFLRNSTFSFNNASRGGGVAVIFQNASHNNIMDLQEISIVRNTAYCGGGMFVHFLDSSTANRLETKAINLIVDNVLVRSENHDMMGGGVHVEFSTVNATFRTGNIVNISDCYFLRNIGGSGRAHGVGGGLSVLYKHSRYEGVSGDGVIVNRDVHFIQNKAAIGSACAFQSLPTHGKRLFRGIRLIDSIVATVPPGFDAMPTEGIVARMSNLSSSYSKNPFKASYVPTLQQLSQNITPTFQEETNTNMIFVKSVQLIIGDQTRNGRIDIICGGTPQGIYALDSEIVLQRDAYLGLHFCVATHGGAIALYGESYIRIKAHSTLFLHRNHAFQRGGAIYVSSAPGVVPASNCFLQNGQGREKSSSRGAIIIFDGNTAKAEGQSVYVADIRNCISRNTTNLPTSLAMCPENDAYCVSSSFVRQVNFTFIYKEYLHNRHWPSLNISHLINNKHRQNVVKKEIASGPNHIGGPGAPVDLSKPPTMRFIPGKQKQLPYTHAYDELGSNISSVFTVLINKLDDSIPVELGPFSKYTADFTVILHGIPQQHGMVNHSLPSNTSNTSAADKPPQLVLQSVDNKDLLLLMDIEIQCCPPGYTYQYGSGDSDMGTCHCGINTVIGIAECNETHPEVIGAVLERDHWAGYLPSNDQHSCDGQKFFTGPCPPGYCQAQPITLPENNSQQELQAVVCAGSNRKGLFCGDCTEGKGIAVNFNGIRPVCASCEEGLSNAGILVWIVSEWVPMLAFMFILMLFNVDLVSGRFNSFLLFAQLLAFSTIRGDAELGPVHNAFVRIYRFLYGMWNLDFFGVLLPPYCLAPHAHLTLLQTLLLHYSIGLFPLTVAITLTILERSAEKWICCHRVDQCLRRMRRWKAKYSDGMSYDRALPAFVILGFTRFLVSSSYILVNQTITGEDGEGKVVVWWQGSVPYGSIQHIAYFIPAIVILLVFVLLPSFLLLTLPIGPQLFGRLIRAVPPLRKLQRMQTFCSNVYTDRWVYHFVNVFQGCYKERFRSFSALYLFYRIVHLFVAVFIPRGEDALRIQIILTVSLLLLIATFQPYNSHKLNTLDAAILGNLALILILSLHTTDLNTPIGARLFYASLQMFLIYLALLYPSILLGKKVYLKCRQLRCCQKQEEQREDNAEPLLEAPAERLGNLVLITELRAGVPTSEDDDSVTETETETYVAG